MGGHDAHTRKKRPNFNFNLLNFVNLSTTLRPRLYHKLTNKIDLKKFEIKFYKYHFHTLEKTVDALTHLSGCCQ